MSFLPKMGCVVNTEFDVDLSALRFGVAGVVDGEAAATLEDAHVLLLAKVKAVLDAQPSCVPFVVGGGNDQSFPNAMALLSHVVDAHDGSADRPRVTVINLDAHLDVRPLLDDGRVHSGSPFRQLLTSDEFKAVNGRFIEFAAQGSQCSAAHAKFVTDSGGTIVWLSDVRTMARDGVAVPDTASKALRHALSLPAAAAFLRALSSAPGDNVFVSFDIDCITGADCPGVSCPATVGLTADEALAIAYLAGRLPTVRLMDVSELNPAVEGYRSPRLVANMFYNFLLGRADRVTHAADDAVLFG